jgi:hypothetical protein
MKKKNVPDTSGKPTPEFVRAVKDNIDAMTGRRGNKINLPEIQTVPFSSPPTQAECQALNAYVNEWYKAMRLLVARFDA